MHKRYKHKRHVQRSIFLKLFFMLIVAALLIMVLVIVFFRSMFSQESQEIARLNAENYARYIIQDIGDPPDTLQALQIARENNLIIYYESEHLTWSSNEDVSFLKTRWAHQQNQSGWWRMHYLIKIPSLNGSYIFGINFKSLPESHAWIITLLIFFILVVLAGLYFSIRYILRPIQWLSGGVNKVSEGDFDQQVPVWKMDQLGQLTTSFNNMTRKIKKMINARNQLLLDVSHEMRSPLTRIKVAMEFIPDEENKKSINDDINELEQMLSEILETERLNSAHQKLIRKKTDLIFLIKDVIPKFIEIEPGIDISGLPEMCYVNGDAERLKICLRNIIGNSLKFSSESTNPVEINIHTERDIHILTFKDFGRGIPEADLPYIFEPFYRVDKSRSKKSGGYGLGLSLCKKIIEAHKGTITINSEEKKGTLVTITLPNPS